MNQAGSSPSERIDSLDLTLFSAIPTQSSEGDRRSWLAVQRSIRARGEYTNLEIGSHLGGSIQQHLVDTRCRTIISIDNCPLRQPDDRGPLYSYEGNSTARMLENLSRVNAHGLAKITFFDSDASDVDPASLSAAPDYCFIDGEHTRAAVLSDASFCFRVCAPNAAICFHDAAVTYSALREILLDLRRRGIPFTARMLEGSTFGIFLRDCPAATDAHLMRSSEDAFRWVWRLRVRSWIPTPLRDAARRIRALFRRAQP